MNPGTQKVYVCMLSEAASLEPSVGESSGKIFLVVKSKGYVVFELGLELE